MLALPQGQGFQPLEEQKRVERAYGRTQITKQMHARLDDERNVAQPGKVAEHVPINDAMVAWIGFGELRELAVVPIKLPGIHDDSAQRRAVAADVFGRRR